MMAVAVLVLIPVLIIFFVGQRWFVQGIALTGLKG
jgi:ABC-type glycerol-3-phosphate transport system permease component